MNDIARFYTIFWVIYFPTCIAFNTLSFFSSLDEAMTFLLIGFTLFKIWRREYMNYEPWSEYKVFFGVFAFYVVYSLIWGENVAGGVFLEILQQIRPYSLIYCTWILNPRFSEKQKNILVWSVVATLALRLVWSPEEAQKFGQITISTGQIAICAGMVWALFKDDTKKNTFIAIMLVLCGISAASKSKFIAEVVCFVGLFVLMKQKVSLISGKMFLIMVVFVSVILSFMWDKIDAYYVTGFQKGGIARAESLRVGFTEVLWDYIPFGPGMGTFATNGAWKYYSPLYYKYGLNRIWGMNEGGGFICDVFYPSLCQYGLVGLFLFGWFWKRRLQGIDEIRDLRYYRIALMSFLCLALEQMADSSWLSGKGMGYCMLIGLSLNANRNQEEEEEYEVDDEVESSISNNQIEIIAYDKERIA